MQPTAGPTAFGKYQLFASLGRGGMADVFLAVARGPMGFNKLAVIKRLRAALAEEGSFLSMFLDEARLAARLNHPNVVHTYEVGEQNGQYFIAMEYLEGQSLNKIIKDISKAGEELSAVMCARIVSDALAGLHHAHELRDYDGTPLEIIHRDISPHNVFVTYEGQVKLVDFGIAKAAMSSTTTEVGVLKGKVAYMAPEQAMGGAIDRRADLFAMGIVLWELVTRKRLMSGESAAATLHRLLNAPIPRASTVIEGLDPRLDDIIAKSLDKAPESRFQTGQEMREALEAWISQSGQVTRQEDIGRRISTLFKQLREDVNRQVQAHMSMVGNAATTQELQALNADSLRRFGAAASASSSANLISLGVGSGSGSGVVHVEGAPAAAAAVPASDVDGTKKRRGLLLAIVLLFVLGVVGFLIFKFVSPKPDVAQAPSATQLATTTGAVSTAMPTLPVNSTTPTATTTLTTTASTSVPSATPSSTVVASAAPSETASAAPTTTIKKPPVPLPPRPTVSVPGTVSAKSTAEPTSTVPEATGPGFLTIDTVPWTRVTVDGRGVGTTPVIGLSLQPGAHTVSLDNPAENVHSVTSVMIKSGEQTRRRLVLKSN